MAGFKIALGTIGAQDLFDGSPASIVKLAQSADKAGIDQIVLTDHVIMSERTDRYPFGTFPMPPEYPWFEPITMMAAMASVTSRIRLATGVLISPLRPATLLAKQIATLDQLSHGRIDLGVGVGWQPEEYTAQGLDFEQRWKLLDDQLEAVKALWHEAPVSVNNSSVQFERLYSTPFPAQKNIPIWFGVAPTPVQAKRIAQFGEGWIPIKTTPEFVRQGCEVIHEAFDKIRRKPAELQVRAHAQMDFSDGSGKADWQRAVDSAYVLVEAGATVIEFEIAPFIRDVNQLDEFLERVVAVKSQAS
jgi:probable F420-dependent oxidoreductase